MNPHIKQIEQDGYEYYTKANPSPLALVIWAANRQRELDEQEIAELRAELEATQGALDAANDELSKQHPDPALAEVLAKFTPPFKYDDRYLMIYDSENSPCLYFEFWLKVADSEHILIATAIAEWLNKNVKKEGI